MKNYSLLTFFGKRKPILPFLRHLKLFVLVTSIATISLSSKSAYSQNERVTLNVNNIKIADVLKEIEKQSDYLFFYNHTEIGSERTISIKAQALPINKVLDDIFRDQQVNYTVKDNHIALTKNSTADRQLSAVQGIPITGTVTDNGLPLVGVNVMIKGTSSKVITNTDGKYQLVVPSTATVLVYSFVGYAPQELVVGDKRIIDIALEEDAREIEEVVVIGYGTARKRDVTGAVSSIKVEALAAQAPRNVQDILRANAAGLTIGMATDAKAEASLSIRGNGTLTAGNNPLIVLDNVIYEGALADINPNDIATIDILKDASASAVYGARSANGVIVISTKRGKLGKPLINVNSSTGFAFSANQPNILDANGFLKFRKDYNEGRNSEAYLETYPQMFTNPFELVGVSQLDWYNYDQATPVTSLTDDQMTKQWLSRLNFTTPEIENYFAGKITQWDDLVFQTALQQDYNVSISNASEYVSQYVSLGYTDREGIIVGDRYKNIRARVNVESKITPFLTAGINAQFASRDEGYLKANWSQMTMISPFGSNNLDDPDSKYQRRPTGLDPINPFYDNLYTDRIDRRQNVIANLFARVRLPFDIEYDVNFSPYYNWYEHYNHYSEKGDNWAAIGGSSTRNLSKRLNWQVDNILRWKKDFADIHKVEVTLLANAEKAQLWGTTANATGYSPNDILGYHRLQAGAVPTVSSDDTYQTGDALMARLFYSLKDKYMVTASIRRDGYSAFGKKNPRAVFPAIALGWTFSEESFMNTDGWFNYGKLRFSWGENGNREIGQYAALSRMSSSLIPYIDQSGNVYSTSQIYVTSMSNYDLKWERTASYNLGLDFALFGNILSGSAEAYIANTNDLLVERALPDITGYTNVMSNLGQLQNNGFELTLNANLIKTDKFQWNASGNFSMNRRKIKSLYGDMMNILDNSGNLIGQKEADDESNGWFIGQDPDRIWAYQRDGVWQKEEHEQAAIYGLQPGDFKYTDQNEDGIMDSKDKVFQGYSTPRFRWSLRNEAAYKGFRLSFMIYSYMDYYGGFQRAANNYSFPDRTSDYEFPRWTSTNPINDYARIGSKNIGTNWIDKSFIRLENVTLSYQVPRHLLNRINIQDLRLSASVQNAGVLASHWNFWDPESGSVTPRTLNFGFNLTL